MKRAALSIEEVRQGLKTFSNWPTYPQLYGKGKLVGGLDIMQDGVANDYAVLESTNIRFYDGNSDTLHSTINVSPTALAVQRLAVGDINGDGNFDLLVGTYIGGKSYLIFLMTVPQKTHIPGCPAEV